MSEETGPTAICSNCDRELPEEKLFLHEAYCVRNIIRCPKCNEPIDKSERDAHEEEVHKLSTCKHCKRDMENKLLAEHEENCNAKPKFCQFCNCEVAGEEFTQHNYQCGSRTKKCIYCNKNILVRDYDDHEAVCQVNQLNYGSNFPSMQEEAKSDLPKNEAPYSSMSSKYVQNPSSNPYDVLTQETKPKTKERPESKGISKPTHHREEERKPTSHKLPEHKPTTLSSKPISSNKPEINSYSHSSKPYEDRTGLASHTKPSVITSKTGLTDYTNMRPTDTTAYTAQTSNYRAGLPEPRSYLADDKPSLSGYSNYLSKPQESGKPLITSKPDINDPLKSKYTSGISGYSKPTDLHGHGISSHLSHGVSRTGAPTSSHIGGITGTKPSVTDSTKTSVRTGISSVGSKIEPAGAKPTTETRSYKPIFPEKTSTTGTTHNRPGVGTGISDKYGGIGISSKDVTTYTTNKPRPSNSGITSGLTDPLPKKNTTSHTDKYTPITGISGSRPSNQDPRTGVTGSRSTKPSYPVETKSRNAPEEIDSQLARAMEAGYHHKNTSGRNEPRSHQTQQHRSGPTHSTTQQSRNAQPNYADYGVNDDHFGGEDEELQRVIQESLGNSRKPVPESRHKPNNRQPDIGADIYGGGEDDELQKAIQESLKNANTGGARSGPNDTWNDEAFKRIIEQSKYEK